MFTFKFLSQNVYKLGTCENCSIKYFILHTHTHTHTQIFLTYGLYLCTVRVLSTLKQLYTCAKCYGHIVYAVVYILWMFLLSDVFTISSTSRVIWQEICDAKLRLLCPGWLKTTFKHSHVEKHLKDVANNLLKLLVLTWNPSNWYIITNVSI